MGLQGVNISGGEFNGQMVPGVYNTNYVYPSVSELDYFRSKGLTCVRVPFSWERMQPNANGPLDLTELGRLDGVIYNATARGLYTIIDPHNYGAYKNVTVGVPGGHPNSMFANFWAQLAYHYKNNPKVVFGLMNEPIGSSMTAATWRVSSQAAIDAIRAQGATNLILVPATYWMHPVNYLQLNAQEMIKITDSKIISPLTYTSTWTMTAPALTPTTSRLRTPWAPSVASPPGSRRTIAPPSSPR